MFAVTTLCRVSLAICPRFYHEAWWGSLMSSLVEKLFKLNFLFFTRIFWYTTQPHSNTTCTDGTRTSSLPINMSRVHLFYKLLWFNKSTAITIKMGNTELNWTLIAGLGSFHFNLLEPMFGHQYHYIQFSLSSVLIQQYFLQILRAIEILKYSIFQISINFPFLNCLRPGQDWSVAASIAGLNYPNSKPSFCIHNPTRPIIFLLEEINPLVN